MAAQPHDDGEPTMLKDLLTAGTTLAGTADPRLKQGMFWSAAEALCAAAAYPVAALFLTAAVRGDLQPSSAVQAGVVLLLLLTGRILCARQAMPALFGGAYATMAQARLRIADHLRRLPLGWFADARSGGLGGMLAGDLQIIEDLWSHALGVFFSGLLAPAFITLALFWLDWRLGGMVLASLPAVFLLLAGGERILNRQSRKLAAAGRDANDELVDYVQGIAVIRGFGRTGRQRQRLGQALTALRWAALRTDVGPAPLLGLFGFAVEAGFALLIWFGAGWLTDGLLSAESLLVAALLSAPIYRQLFDVGLAFLMLRFARQALHRTRGLLAVPPLPEPAAPKPPTRHDITFDAVRFAYDGGTPLFDNLTLTIPQEKVTAVVGRSGSGKTTLLNLIARLWDVQAGMVRVGGVDVREIGSAELQRRTAMVFQEVTLFSGSVLDNLRVGKPEATVEEVMLAARRAHAHDFILRLPQGYETMLGEAGGTLSGGERQRLSIARALLKDAPLLLLDEATASIDPSAEAEVQQALSTLAEGRTVVIIAHRLRSVRNADQILVLDHGRLAEAGNHDSLMAGKGLYASLWRRQADACHWSVGGKAS